MKLHEVPNNTPFIMKVGKQFLIGLRSGDINWTYYSKSSKEMRFLFNRNHPWLNNESYPALANNDFLFFKNPEDFSDFVNKGIKNYSDNDIKSILLNLEEIEDFLESNNVNLEI